MAFTNRAAAAAAAAPTTTAFLTEIKSLVSKKQPQKLRDYLVIEPPYSASYGTVIDELRRCYPDKGGSAVSGDEGLERLVASVLGDVTGGQGGGGGGGQWNAFLKFVSVYLGFLRDVDVANLLQTYELLEEVLQKANSALTHPTHGILILPTVVTYAHVLSRLAIGLDKQPHLIAHLKSASSDADGPRETLPERAANVIRQAFVTCLNDRSGSSPTGLDRSGKPEGKKQGIYTIANLCLKVLFACRKTRGCAQIFENIYNQSPPLSAYPKAERVTYLFYLGRFLWGNGHGYRAQRALQKAWDECHPQALSQRRLILIFLTSANLVCGRFPSAQLFERPEARGLREVFEPLCRFIRQGNMCAFRRYLDPDGEHYAWFSYYRLDLQLRNRCEVFVWRSLIRRTYLLVGEAGDPETRKAPTLNLNYVLGLFRWQERLYLTPNGASAAQAYVDPDFGGMNDLDLFSDEALGLPDMNGVFSKMSALIHQGFLGGYLAYARQRFAIQGARVKGAMSAGFPNIWQTVEKRCDEVVPGWKIDDKKQIGGFGGVAKSGGFGPGQVINLSGARPVGASPFG